MLFLSLTEKEGRRKLASVQSLAGEECVYRSCLYEAMAWMLVPAL